MTKTKKYDVALSFAGEQRNYVREVAKCLKDIYKLNVFYDEFEISNMWGKNLPDYLHQIYSQKAKHVILFISKEFRKKPYPNFEKKCAIERMLKSKKDYILIVKFDNIKLQGLPDTLFYIDGNKVPPYEVAKIFVSKYGILEENRWFGIWERKTGSIITGSLKISKIEGDSFQFDLQVAHGAHTGEIKGTAKISQDYKYKAKWKKQIEDNKKLTAELNFTKMGDYIRIDSNENTRYFCGAGTYFDGYYEHQKIIFYDIDEITDRVLSFIYQKLGEELFEKFESCFLDYNIERDSNKIIIKGWARGSVPCYNGILIIKRDNIAGSFINIDIDEEYAYWFSSNNYLENEIKIWAQKNKKELRNIREVQA